MKKCLPAIAALLFLAACSEPSGEAHTHATQTEDAETDSPRTEVTLGNGDENAIEQAGMNRVGPTLIVPSVMAEMDSFLVLHAFQDGHAVQTDYVASAFVPAGKSEDVMIRLEQTPETGEPFIIMLHRDVNADGMFQFGDGVTVPDAPVFEGSTLIASPMAAPVDGPVTPDIIRNSPSEHEAMAALYGERAGFRENAAHAKARAVVHRWLAGIERSVRSVDEVAPLFAESFTITFTSGPITSLDGIAAWLDGPPATMEATRHVLHDVTVEPLGDDRYAVGMEMEWDGLRPDGRRMTARTRHDWQMVDVGGAMKIMTVDVEILEPFAPADWK